ncbi:MAG: translocation/assembly module TamB [Parachlamydiales bacterium]|nr:translocation/assembly module TamB [Parachlamydiales bacterium]
MKRIYRWTARIVGALLFLAACLFVATLIVVQTNWAKNKILTKINESLKESQQMTIELGSLKGFFPFDITLTDIALRNTVTNEIWLKVDGIHLSWDPLVLWNNTLHCHLLRLRNPVVLSLPESKKPKTPGEFHLKEFIDQFPFKIDIDRLAITGFRLKVYDRPESWNVQGAFELAPRSRRNLDFDLHITSSLIAGADIECLAVGDRNQLFVNAKLNSFAIKSLPPQYPRIFVGASTSGTWQQWEDFINLKPVEFQGDVQAQLSPLTKKSPQWVKTLFGRKGRGTGQFTLSSDLNVTLRNFQYTGKQLRFVAAGMILNKFKNIDVNVDMAIDEIEPLSEITHLNLKGPAHATLAIHNELIKPDLYATIRSDQIYINETNCRNVEAEGSLIITEDGGKGSIKANSRVEDLPLSVTTDYTFSPSDFAFNNFVIDRQTSHLTGSLKFIPQPSLPIFQYLLVGDVNATIPDILMWSFIFNHRFEDVEGGFATQLILDEANGIQILSGDMTIDYISHQSYDIQTTNIHAELSNPFVDPLGTIHLTTDQVHLGTLNLSDFDGTFELDEELIPFNFSTKGSYRTPFEVQAAGFYHKSLTQLDLIEFDGNVLNYPLHLDAPFFVLKTDQQFLISPLALDIDQGRLEMQMKASYNDSNLQATLTDVPLDLLTLALPQSVFTGKLSGKVDLVGNASQTTGSAQFDIETSQKNDDAKDGLHYLPLVGSIHVSFLPKSTHLDANIEGLGVRPLQAEFNLPMYFQLFPFTTHLEKNNPIDGYLHWEGQLSEIFNLFLIEGNPFSGDLYLQASASGTLANPDLKGKITLNNGGYESPVTGAIIKNIEAEASADGRQITLDSLTAVDNEGGDIKASGYLTLDENMQYPYEVTVDFNKATLLNLDLAKASFDGSLTLGGTRYASILKGNIKVDEAHINIPKQINTKIPTVDVVYKHALPKEEDKVIKSTPLNPLSLNVTVTAPRKIFLAGRGVTAEWKGDINVTSTPMDPNLKGILQLVKGEVNLLGRTFAITQGTITFGGKPPKDIFMYIVSQFDVTGYNVRAIVQGPITTPELTFESNPYLPTTEILSRILFGTGVADISPLQGFQLAQALITISGTYAGPDILGTIQQGIGLDQLTITSADSAQAGTTVPVLQAGKYISEGVFVSIDKTLSEDASTTGFEARLINEFRVRVEVSEEDENTVLLEWKHDY